jgi:molybdopterin synthase catalytic subunit
LNGRKDERLRAFAVLPVITAAASPPAEIARQNRYDGRMSVRITEHAIDTAAEAAALARIPNAGALVTFAGLCRGEEEGAPIAALVLEHYPGMAEAEIGRHIEEAKARWPLMGARVVHRVGRIVPGETIVFVATASMHRQAAFAAAEFLMDYLKTRAPFWKKVERDTGSGRWVEAQAKDDTAAARWTKNPDAAE